VQEGEEKSSSAPQAPQLTVTVKVRGKGRATKAGRPNAVWENQVRVARAVPVVLAVPVGPSSTLK